MGKEKKRGQAGNAVQYITRNQAMKKLQLSLSVFRRLCILKGIHPREPKKKTQGQNKTYYHVKDINYLAHEPLLVKLRDAHSYERKIRKARAKKNADLAQRLAALRPTHKLDHLVKERYPSFVDALRDLDDPLTMVHLFATLPAEQQHGIPAKAVQTSRRLALEWQAWVVRTGALRKAFVSVKGFYFQADCAGQPVTWLVPHSLSQVLPADVDYRVMLTFLDFYHSLLQFVLFKLYHGLGVRYPPRVDPKLEEAAAGLTAIMQDLAHGQPDQALPSAPAPAQPAPEVERRLITLPDKLRQLQQAPDEPMQTAEPAGAEQQAAAEAATRSGRGGLDDIDEDEDEAGSISSGGDSDEEDEQQRGIAGSAGSRQAPAQPAAVPSSAGALDAAHYDQQQQQQDGVEEPDQALASVAGSAAAVDADDEASVCSSLFRGLVFYLGREVPREALLLVLRAFGGIVGWEGEGSPLAERDDAITHQIVDRPTQGHVYLNRAYVQPQWAVDAANWRVLPDAALYAPGRAPPPHLSPFANVDDDDEGYVPDYARALQALQEAAQAARRRAAGQAAADAFMQVDASAGADLAAAAEQGTPAEDEAAAAERLHAAELARELRAAEAAAAGEAAAEDEAEAEDMQPGNEGAEAPAAVEPVSKAATRKRPAEAAAAQEDNEDDMAAVMLPRKARNLYQSVRKRTGAKQARVAQLRARAAALAGGADAE